VSHIAWRCLAALGFLLLVGLLLAPLFGQPFEDAIILFQYSANLAQTGVISFIPHGPPAEGATDFLWMVYLAAGQVLRIPSYGLAVLTSALCVVMLGVVLIRLARQRVTTVNLLATVCLILLAPQTWAAAAGFSVFAFALALALMAGFAWCERYGAAVLAGLILCLIRPDGVVFAGPLLLVYLFRGADLRGRAAKLSLGFVLPGVAYFLWRWHYFGLLLPLPFYVKSDTPRLLGVLVLRSAIGLAPPLAAACIALGLALRRAMLERRNLVLFLSLIVPSSLFYLMLRLDQNFANRFFLYPLLVMAVLLAANFERARARLPLLGLATWVLVLGYFWINWAVIYTLEYAQPQVVAVSRALRTMPGTMLVTESGAIPFYSEWTAYDAWGLNTPAFARQLIQPEDVRRLQPDLIVVHTETRPTPCALAAGDSAPRTARSWENMTHNVMLGIDQSQYSQWLLPQFSPYYRSHPRRWNGQTRPGRFDYQCWFLRNGFADSGRIANILAQNGGLTPAEYVALTRQ
jgi:hypothetical protein